MDEDISDWMKVLVIGGTRFFGIPMIEELLARGHQVTIATKGIKKDGFGNRVLRICLDRTDKDSIKRALKDKFFDVVIDKIAYCSNDIKYVMDVVNCNYYIEMSSTAVYQPKHWDTKEQDFDPSTYPLQWCNREDSPYDETKRQAESALFQVYAKRNVTTVRYPIVLGKGDYTKRLEFYVEHVIKGIPMNIDHPEYQMGYIGEEEAGRFLAFLTENAYTGAINGSASGTISIGELLKYIEEKTGIRAIICEDGEEAPYNGQPQFSINTDKAKTLGFQFSNLKDWIFPLIDYYILQVTSKDNRLNIYRR